MSQSTSSPYHGFKQKLQDFAKGQQGIRNPFVIAAVDPQIEHRVASRLESWASDRKVNSEIPSGIDIQPVRLDELLPQTDVYKLLVDLGGALTDLDGDRTANERVKQTMQDRLAREIVQQIIESELTEEQLETQSCVVLLLNLGSLYPFTRASELLDELDRRNVKSTIGIPFPGNIVSGSLSFFGGESRRYYPAHQIDGRIQEEDLQ